MVENLQKSYDSKNRRKEDWKQSRQVSEQFTCSKATTLTSLSHGFRIKAKYYSNVFFYVKGHSLFANSLKWFAFCIWTKQQVHFPTSQVWSQTFLDSGIFSFYVNKHSMDANSIKWIAAVDCIWILQIKRFSLLESKVCFFYFFSKQFNLNLNLVWFFRY